MTPTPEAPSAEAMELLQTLLNAAHTVGQDDFKEVSYQACKRHHDAWILARDNMESEIKRLLAAEEIGRAHV